MKSSALDLKFTQVSEALLQERSVTLGGGKGFGAGALKVNGKIFAMLSAKKQFVVKLPRARVDELIAKGAGEHFEPRPGQLMKEWLVLKASSADWINWAQEACEFVRGGK